MSAYSFRGCAAKKLLRLVILNKNMHKCWSGLLATVLLTPAFADTSVWKISKGDRHLYLGGTVHVLSQDDYPLPEAFERAYQSSQKIVLETDMQALQSPHYQQRMMVELSYSNGRSLANVLSEATFQKLERYCQSRGIEIGTILGFKAGMASTVLLLIEMQRLGLAGEGVDAFYNARAVKDKKQLGQLETVDQQLKLVATMGEGQEDQLIEYTLSDINNLASLMKDIKHAWREGDIQVLEQIGIEPYSKQFPDTLNDLLSDRNYNWLPKIESMLATPQIEFVLVGALHLAGDQGLLALLKSHGYDLQQY